IRGQEQAVQALDRAMRASAAGPNPPEAPAGVFLLVGPSGVGKTETALALADLLFGGERVLTTINMSEFQARHTVSQLIGAPPGVCLRAGPSGVGQAEPALARAGLLVGGERFLTTITMSEFQERHPVSQLIGAPPGYVGYGEGGRLTEAVRQRPYSVVLLD